MKFGAGHAHFNLNGATLQAQRWISRRLLRNPVRDLPIDLAIPLGRETLDTLGPPAIVDGLGAVACFRPDLETRREAHHVAARLAVMDVRLRGKPGIRNFDIAWSRRTAVMQLPCISDTRVRSLQAGPLAEKSCARSLSLVMNVPAVGSAGNWFFRGDTRIHTGTTRIRKMPQIRSAEERDSLTLQECESFLREAEAGRGIPAGRGELLAVFRRIPVEEVSKIRFVEAKGLLFFTCEQDRKSRQTRVHDVAAIRNGATAQTHLVAHRTRFHTVALG